MTSKPFNLSPLEKLLHEEDPLEIAQYLDDVMLTLVQHSDNEGYVEGLGHRYYILRVLRDAISACVATSAHKYPSVKPGGYGNP